MVIRGGFYMAYEMNIFNNTIFNEFALIPPGIGPDSFDFSHVTGPDGKPIVVDNVPSHQGGDYSDLGRRADKRRSGNGRQGECRAAGSLCQFQIQPVQRHNDL